MNARIRRLSLVTVIASALLASALTSTATGAGRPGSLSAVRQVTAKYHDVAAAVADGYVPVSDCVAGPGGAMGIHYGNPALFSQPVDPLHPALLLYVPGDEGLQLAGVEYFQADADQDLSTDDDRPSLFGQQFDGPMEGHGGGMPVHYDLHVWVWRHNPAGMFAELNPALSC